MGIALTIAGLYVPRFIRKRKIVRLFSATADAFGAAMPPVEKLSAEECLKVYALFTREKAEEAIRNGNDTAVKERLYRSTFRLGTALREEFGIRNMKQTMRLARMVYQMVGIDFKGGQGGDVVISQCFFSRWYSPAICGIVQSLDAGLLSGISGGGRLSFSERLTAGSECCRAVLSSGVKRK